MVYTWIGDVRPLLQGSCYTKYWRQLPEHRLQVFPHRLGASGEVDYQGLSADS